MTLDAAHQVTPLNPVISATSLRGSAPFTVTFDGSQSNEANSSIIAWNWAFGDGSSATGSTATHTFTTDGTYGVALTVTDASGRTNLTTVNITVFTSSTILAPTNLTATYRAGYVTLRWTDNSNNEDSFHIQRSKNGDPWEHACTVDANVTKCTVAVGSGTFQYQVRGVKTSGTTVFTSAWSNLATITVP